MIEKNCLTCKNFIIHKTVKKGNNIYSQGFAFGQDNKPCEHYPDNLSTGRDIMEAYVCEHYEPTTIRITPDMQGNAPHMSPFMSPFSMAIPIASFANSSMTGNRQIDRLEKSVRRLYFVIGLLNGIIFGILIIQIFDFLVGK